MPQFGFGFNLLVICLVLAVVLSVAAWHSPGDFLLGAVILWAITGLVWRLLRWWAERRYAPRPLPQRRRER